jgi:hypothetical protein
VECTFGGLWDGGRVDGLRESWGRECEEGQEKREQREGREMHFEKSVL